jgi:uncharacterized membrane protein
VAPWQVSTLIGWALTAVIFLVWVWRIVHPLDAAQTQAIAGIEDPGPSLSRAVVLAACVASIAAVIAAFVEARALKSPESWLVITLGVTTIALSWLTVHTVYMLHYARLYYSAEPGGIEFGPEPPSYRDFAYVAFTVGMTYQVADTNVVSPTIRRAVLRHAGLSFVFGTVIVALTINLTAGLLH